MTRSIINVNLALHRRFHHIDSGADAILVDNDQGSQVNRVFGPFSHRVGFTRNGFTNRPTSDVDREGLGRRSCSTTGANAEPGSQAHGVDVGGILALGIEMGFVEVGV